MDIVVICATSLYMLRPFFGSMRRCRALDGVTCLEEGLLCPPRESSFFPFCLSFSTAVIVGGEGRGIKRSLRHGCRGFLASIRGSRWLTACNFVFTPRRVFTRTVSLLFDVVFLPR